MNSSRYRIFFWCLLAAQAAGYAAFMWEGVPTYRNLVTRGEGAGLEAFDVSLIAIAVMQSAYWLAGSLQRRLQFRRNVVPGTVLMWLAEIIYFFPHALAVVIVFDRIEELEFRIWKMFILVGLLFSVYCFKLQLETVGEAMIADEEISDDQRKGGLKKLWME